MAAMSRDAGMEDVTDGQVLMDRTAKISGQESEKDINDLFEDLAFPEAQIAEEAFQEGLPRGEAVGKFYGYHLGYHSGLKIGTEIGFYKEIIHQVTQSPLFNTSKQSDKVTGLLEKMRDSLEKFPCDNSEDVDIVSLITGIRINFRKLMSQLKLKMQEKIEHVRLHLSRLVEFFSSFSSLANAHFVSVITKDHWHKVVPQSIRNELAGENKLEEFVQVYPEIIRSGMSLEFAQSHPNLATFFNQIKALSITTNGHLKSLDHFLSELATNRSIEPDFGFNHFMSQKKLHEVRMTTRLAAIISYLTETSHVIDVGGGKGYLSWILALNHHRKVLGLDASISKTCGASKTSQKVAALWTSEGDHDTKDTRRSFVKRYYKSAAAYVTSETDVASLVREHFQEEPQGVTLTGLHTCGNLAGACLRLFVASPDIRAIVNVGCCYQWVTEEFGCDGVDESGGSEAANFPMSEFLRKKGFSLGQNARSVASQSIEKLVEADDVAESITSLFYRAILETLTFNGETVPGKRIGRLSKKCSSFHEYISKAVKRLGLDVEVTERYARELYEAHADLKPMTEAFFWIRVSLAPVVESIILLDRFLYLLEQGIDNAYLLKLFDLTISPRGFALVAWKGSSGTETETTKN